MPYIVSFSEDLPSLTVILLQIVMLSPETHVNANILTSGARDLSSWGSAYVSLNAAMWLLFEVPLNIETRRQKNF